MQTKSYQGWTNYATWCVKLWIDNEEPSYRHWRQVARDVAEDGEQPIPGTTVMLEPRLVLAERLQEELHDAAPDLGGTVWSDLLTAALSEVNYEEIAASMLEDLAEDGEVRS